MSAISLEVRESLEREQLTAITHLMNAAAEADGAHPFSEAVLLKLRSNAHHLLVYKDAELAGYAFIDREEQPAKVELAVHPHFRRQGIGTALLEKAMSENADLHLWAHGTNATSTLLAERMGFHNIRAVLQMRRSLLTPIADAHFPPHVLVRRFNTDTDIKKWLALNQRVFANHPEQGQWNQTDLEARLSQPWFDADGFIVALLNDEMIGFHWTKVHHFDSRDSLGEMYILGVHPNHQVQGLGKALTLAGLKHLREIGMTTAMLYTDEANTRAIALYQSVGFTEWDRDTLFARIP